MNRHLILQGGAAIGVLLLATAFWHQSGSLALEPRADALAAPVTPASDEFKRVWTIAAPGYRTSALSPDGNFVGVVTDYTPGTATERLSLWRWSDRPDKPLWGRAAPASSLVVVGTGGKTVLSCAQMSQSQRNIVLRKGADGSVVVSKQMDGPIWDAQMSTDGEYAGVTTGNRGLYLFTLDDRPRLHYWPLDGIGNTVSLASNNTYLAAGTWDRSGVTCYTEAGTRVWQYPAADDNSPAAAEDRLFEAQVTAGGRFILGVSYANAHHSDGRLYLWRADGDGTPLWIHSLGVDTSMPKALITDDGQFVAVTYLKQITRGDQSITERELLVLDGTGSQVWQKGNLLFAPTLVALAPDGHCVTVSDGQKTLYNLNTLGRITSIYSIKGAATIHQTVATPDGRSILVYTSDGQLSLFQIG